MMEPILKLIEKRLENLESQQQRIRETESNSHDKGKGKGKSKDRSTLNEDLSVSRYKRKISILTQKYTNLRIKVAEFSAKLQPIVKDVVNLMYFGSLFDDDTDGLDLSWYARCVMSYTLSSFEECLREDQDVFYPKYHRYFSKEDLYTISDLANLVTSPPIDTNLSPKDTLATCLMHANLWLSASEDSFVEKEQEPQVEEDEEELVEDEQFFDNFNCFPVQYATPEVYTYSLLRKKLYRIMLSSFSTTHRIARVSLDPPIAPIAPSTPITSVATSISKTLQNLIREDPNQKVVSDLIQHFNFLFPRLPPSLEEEEETETQSHQGMDESLFLHLLHLVFLGLLFERKHYDLIKLTKRMRSFERKRLMSFLPTLSDDDLSSISMLRGLVCSRTIPTNIPHMDMLNKHCLPHAKLWISNSHQPIKPGSPYTYQKVKNILNEIMTSDYFTTPFQPFRVEKVEETEKLWLRKQANEVKLWMRDAKEVQKDEYIEFYKKTFSEIFDPLAYTHFTIEEGEFEIRSVLYIPGIAPCNNNKDLAIPKMKDIRLYFNRLFFCNDLEDDLFPKYLSFVKGVVDSNSYHQVQTLRERVVTKTIDMIWEISKRDNKEDYKKFWKKFGKYFKWGCIVDRENHKRITPLLQFTSTKSEGNLKSLDDYVENMGEGQNTIYCLATDSLKNAKTVPITLKLRQMDIEVLFLEEQTDEDIIQNLQTYKEKIFLNISKEDLELGDEDEVKEWENKQDYSLVCNWIKQQLVDKVAKVQVSKRLSSTPCGLVSLNFGMLMKAQPLGDALSLEFMKGRKILEINPGHPIIKYLSAASKNAPESDEAKRAVNLLYHTALFSNGELSPHAQAEFSSQMFELMAIAFGGMMGR